MGTPERANSSIKGRVEDPRGLKLAVNMARPSKDLMRDQWTLMDKVRLEAILARPVCRDLMRNFH